jgi:hypothetical protein
MSKSLPISFGSRVLEEELPTARQLQQRVGIKREETRRSQDYKNKPGFTSLPGFCQAFACLPACSPASRVGITHRVGPRQQTGQRMEVLQRDVQQPGPLARCINKSSWAACNQGRRCSSSWPRRQEQDEAQTAGQRSVDQGRKAVSDVVVARQTRLPAWRALKHPP